MSRTAVPGVYPINRIAERGYVLSIAPRRPVRGLRWINTSRWFVSAVACERTKNLNWTAAVNSAATPAATTVRAGPMAKNPTRKPPMSAATTQTTMRSGHDLPLSDALSTASTRSSGFSWGPRKSATFSCACPGKGHLAHYSHSIVAGGLLEMS